MDTGMGEEFAVEVVRGEHALKTNVTRKKFNIDLAREKGENFALWEVQGPEQKNVSTPSGSA